MTAGMVNNDDRRVVTACSLAGSLSLVRALNSVGRFLRMMDRNAKATFDAIAIFAARVVSSFVMVATFRLPSVEAYATP